MPDISPADVCRLIATNWLNLTNEKQTQADLAAVLARAGIAFEREKRLAAGDIVDFLVEGGIAVECKLRRAQKASVFKQLQRYAKHESVRAIILATNLSMGLPEEIEGKPAYYASLGRAWV